MFGGMGVLSLRPSLRSCPEHDKDGAGAGGCLSALVEGVQREVDCNEWA